jgi:hypothetical protein
MSDETQVRGSVEAASLDAITEDAHRRTGHARITPVTDDDVADLRRYCMDFILKANLSAHAYTMVGPKLDEMIFWITAGMKKE